MAHRVDDDSFHIKYQHKSLQLAKVSIHGPDPKHLGKDHFRFDLTETKQVERALRAGSSWELVGGGGSEQNFGQTDIDNVCR